MFFEVVIKEADMVSTGIQSRDEIEDPLAQGLEDSGIGEVTGGGGGMGSHTIDVEMSDDLATDDAAKRLLDHLKKAGAPHGTTIRAGSPDDRTWKL